MALYLYGTVCIGIITVLIWHCTYMALYLYGTVRIGIITVL